MVYFLAEVKKEENKDTIVEVKKEINATEIKNLYQSLEVLVWYRRIKHIYNISIINGQELEKFLRRMRKTVSIYSLKKEDDKNIIEANRLILNYCSAIGMYIDIMEKSLSNIERSKLDSFQKYCSELYDNKMEYRFWVIFRNYVIHYDMPFSIIRRTIEGTEIMCNREQLLKFTKWKHVKNDLMKMEENIDILPLIVPMSVNLTLLYFNFIFNIADKIIFAYEQAGKFILENKIIKPVVIKSESVEEYKKGKFIITPIEFNDLQEAFEDVKAHPHINLIINDITPEWIKSKSESH